MNRGEAVNWLINLSADIGKREHQSLWHYEQALSEIKDMLESSQPERMHGKWLPDNTCCYETRFVCSKCGKSERVPTIGFTKYKPIWNFCPNCGDDKREERGNG